MEPGIMTSVEAAENAILPGLCEVHADPSRKAPDASALAPPDGKSAARWAWERLILYIKNFEDQLDDAQEIAMGFAGGEAGVIRIEGVGYFDPDLVTFYGTDESGARTQLIQHVTRLSVMLRALPKAPAEAEPRRIGFQLVRGLDAAPVNNGVTGAPAASGQG